MSIKKLTYTDVGGCGGSVYRSQRRAGVAVQVQYSITPTWDFSTSSHDGASLTIRRLKKGTVGSWIGVESIECDSVESAKATAQAFDDYIQNPEFNEDEAKLLEAAEEIRVNASRARFTEALSKIEEFKPTTEEV